jgi:hypothetical protein
MKYDYTNTNLVFHIATTNAYLMNNLKKPTYSHHDKLRGQSESNLFSYAEIKIDNVINLLIHVTTH